MSKTDYNTAKRLKISEIIQSPENAKLARAYLKRSPSKGTNIKVYFLGKI